MLVTAGVGLLAANDLLNGMVATLYLHTFYASHLRTVLTTMRSRVSLSNTRTGAMGLAGVDSRMGSHSGRTVGVHNRRVHSSGMPGIEERMYEEYC